MAIFFCWMCIHTPRISSELSNYVSSKILSIFWLQAARIWICILPLSWCFVNFITSSTTGLFVISRKRLSCLCSIPCLIAHSKEKWNVHREINVTADYFPNSSKIWCLLKLWLRQNAIFACSSARTSFNFPINTPNFHLKNNCLEGTFACSLRANSVLDFLDNTRRKVSFLPEIVAWNFEHLFINIKCLQQ